MAPRESLSTKPKPRVPSRFSGLSSAELGLRTPSSLTPLPRGGAAALAPQFSSAQLAPAQLGLSAGQGGGLPTALAPRAPAALSPAALGLTPGMGAVSAPSPIFPATTGVTGPSSQLAGGGVAASRLAANAATQQAAAMAATTPGTLTTPAPGAGTTRTGILGRAVNPEAAPGRLTQAAQARGFTGLGTMARAGAGRAAGIGLPLAMALNATGLTGGDSTIDQFLEGAAVGGSAGSVGGVPGAIGGGVIGGGLNVLRNLIMPDAAPGTPPADVYATLLTRVTPEIQQAFIDRKTLLTSQGMSEDEAMTQLLPTLNGIVDQQFQQQLMDAQTAASSNALSADDILQLQAYASSVMRPIAQQAEQTGNLGRELYDSLAGTQPAGVADATRGMGIASQMGGDRLAAAYRAQAAMAPLAWQTQTNIAQSYQQPAASASGDIVSQLFG